MTILTVTETFINVYEIEVDEVTEEKIQAAIDFVAPDQPAPSWSHTYVIDDASNEVLAY